MHWRAAWPPSNPFMASREWRLIVRRPRLKGVFPPTRLDSRRIAIGGIDHGFAAEIEDDDAGHVWHLLSLLDGSRDPGGIARDMRARDVSLRPEDVQAAVASLAAAGYVE